MMEVSEKSVARLGLKRFVYQMQEILHNLIFSYSFYVTLLPVLQHILCTYVCIQETDKLALTFLISSYPNISRPRYLLKQSLKQLVENNIL